MGALFDLKPRLGEIDIDNHFRFKITLIGDAGVGKSSLIKQFVKKDIDRDYKLTVGLDLMRQDIYIPDNELPKEGLKIINKALSNYKKKLKKIRRKEKN